MSKIIIVSKTKMANNHVCVGGIDLDNKISVRLLDTNGYHESADTCPFKIRDTWDIEYSRHNQRPLPHSEDVRVISKKKTGELKNEISILDLLNRIQFRIYQGGILNTFEGKLKSTDSGTLYISGDSVPKYSTCFWVCDREIKRNDYQNKIRYNYVAQTIFNTTMTVEHFKRNIGTKKLHLKSSATSGKGFVTDDAGNVVAALSNKITQASDLKDPIIGIFDNGIACLCNQSETGITSNDKTRRWGYNIAYVGLEENPAQIIPQGTLVRLSLAHWWLHEGEEKCFLQLSGWY